jgi:hypothetical protein
MRTTRKEKMRTKNTMTTATPKRRLLSAFTTSPVPPPPKTMPTARLAASA